MKLRLGWVHYLSRKHASPQLYYNADEGHLGYMLPLLAQQRSEVVETVARQILIRDAGHYCADLCLIIVFHQQTNLPPAKEIVDRMLKLYLTDVTFLTQQALALDDQNNRATARAAFNRVLTLGPENVLAKQRPGIVP